MHGLWGQFHRLFLAMSLSATFISCQHILCDRSFMGHVASGIISSHNFPLNYSTMLRTCRYRIYSSRAEPSCPIANKPLKGLSTNNDTEPNKDMLTNYNTENDSENIAPILENSQRSRHQGISEPPMPFWNPINSNEHSLNQIDELVCFRFYRFSLRMPQKNSSSPNAFLEFPGGMKYCGKGTLCLENPTNIRKQTYKPENVFVDDFCWPIPQDSEYLEVKFSVYSTEEFTDRGFYAKYDVRKASNTLNTSHEFNKEVTTHARISSVLTAPCPEGHFMCFDRTCIEQRSMCDGINDCQDGSDETYIHARCAGRQSYEGCDFEITPGVEREMCGFRAYNWKRGRSSSYGPRYDHTIGKAWGPGNFTYTHFNFEKILLFSDDPSNATTKAVDRCFRFWYFMSGEGIGRLNVILTTHSSQVSQNTSAWSRKGEHGSYWHMGELDIPSYITSIEQIAFEGVRGSFIEANIGLDDISMMDGKCDGDDISCTFELGTCTWGPDEKYEAWVRRQGSEILHDNGPDKDGSNNADGYFMFFDSSNSTTDTARMVSKPVSEFPYNPRWCLSFCYLIQKGKGTFRVRVRHVDQSENILFWDKHEQGWYHRQFNIKACKPIQIILEAQADSSGLFQVAVDNIVLSQDRCREDAGTTTVKMKTTTSNLCQINFCCGDGKPISKDRVCDGRFDCDDKSDEADCSIAGLSALGIAAIVGGILLVMIFIILHLVWKVKRKRRVSRQDNRVPYPDADWEETPDIDSYSSPVHYGEPPPLYNEVSHDSGNSPQLNQHPEPRTFLTISLTFEPPPAYDISIVGVPSSAQTPQYTPRSEPPSFEYATRDPRGPKRPRPKPPPYHVHSPSSTPAIPEESSSRGRRTIISGDTSPRLHFPINQPVQSALAGMPALGQELQTFHVPVDEPVQSALAGAPAIGQELERYRSPIPRSLWSSPNCSRGPYERGRKNRWSLRRSFRRLNRQQFL